jgi:hypothetical protein
MDIDWTNIRAALSRIEKQLSRAREVIDVTDEETSRGWPEVSRAELQSAFPNWQVEYGKDWMHDFMEKRIGRENFRIRKGNRKYRIAPECYKTLRPAMEGAPLEQPALERPAMEGKSSAERGE